MLLLQSISAQNGACSKLGAWIWHLEITGFSDHQYLADSLQAMGIKRVYVKVADGGINANSWPEIVDETLVDIYKTRGMEVYAWSYNYPGNDEAQAEALYQAAVTGYQGYVVDVEIEFNGDSQALNNLFGAFAQSKGQLEDEGLIDEEFKLYCTTWGNPKDHDFYLSVIDPYVDGYLAQTYVEQWGSGYVENLEFWIGEGNKEYAEMGATKPVHHILAMQDGNVSSERANAFFETAGAESSIWRVPGGSIDQSLWDTWDDIDWEMDFCEFTSLTELEENLVNIYPNPFQDFLQLDLNDPKETVLVQLYDVQGGLVFEQEISFSSSIDLGFLNTGIYFCKLKSKHGIQVSIVSKN